MNTDLIAAGLLVLALLLALFLVVSAYRHRRHGEVSNPDPAGAAAQVEGGGERQSSFILSGVLLAVLALSLTTVVAGLVQGSATPVSGEIQITSQGGDTGCLIGVSGIARLSEGTGAWLVLISSNRQYYFQNQNPVMLGKEQRAVERARRPGLGSVLQGCASIQPDGRRSQH